MSRQEIIIGNSLDELRKFPTESIDMVVTSPPYWALRDYKSTPVVWGGEPNCSHEWNDHIESTQDPEDVDVDDRGHPTVTQYCKRCGAWKGQLGLEPSPFEYIQHLIQIFDEVNRTLKPTGSCWVNIGDTYNGYKNGNTDVDKNGKAVSSSFIKSQLKGIKQKSLCMIPERFAIAMCDRGWILRNKIIWHKPNVMPQSMTDRFTVDYESFFFFTKEPRYYFNQLKETMQRPNMRSHYGGQKVGNSFNTYSSRKCDAANLNNQRNMRTVWSINTQPSNEDHCAMFPKSLVERPIKACCPEDGIVLDPFAGSGTVLEYCFDNDINGIGIEINPSYKKIIERRMHKNQGKLSDFIGSTITGEIA